MPTTENTQRAIAALRRHADLTDDAGDRGYSLGMAERIERTGEPIETAYCERLEAACERLEAAAKQHRRDRILQEIDAAERRRLAHKARLEAAMRCYDRAEDGSQDKRDAIGAIGKAGLEVAELDRRLGALADELIALGGDVPADPFITPGETAIRADQVAAAMAAEPDGATPAPYNTKRLHGPEATDA